MSGDGKGAERSIAERIATELIQAGVLDDRKDVEIRVFSPRLGATEIRVRFPQEEAADGDVPLHRRGTG